jgi:hypothetical protein
VGVRVPEELLRPAGPGRVVVDRDAVTADRVSRAFLPWHADVEPDPHQLWQGYLQPEMTLTLRNLVGADTLLPLRQREDEFVELGLVELAVWWSWRSGRSRRPSTWRTCGRSTAGCSGTCIRGRGRPGR